MKKLKKKKIEKKNSKFVFEENGNKIKICIATTRPKINTNRYLIVAPWIDKSIKISYIYIFGFSRGISILQSADPALKWLKFLQIHNHYCILIF